MIYKTSLHKQVLLVLSFLLLCSTITYGAKKDKLKKYKISGTILAPDGDAVPKGIKIVLKSELLKKETLNKKTLKKGSFNFGKQIEGVYSINIDSPSGVADYNFTLSSETGDISISLSEKEIPINKNKKEVKSEEINSAPIPKMPKATGGISNDFILNELNFEIKKLTAEFKHLSREMDDLKALSKMWINPLTIYSKEIILKNGSTVFGKIIYQDDKSLKVETLVGYLIIKRNQVVRIVDNVITEGQQEYIPEQIRESYSPPPMPRLTVPKYASPNVSERELGKKFSANCVLMGNITEKKDSQGNILFNGEIKNIGGRRSDFVKIDFVFRKNWSGETKTLTTFVKGSYNTFESGIVSDASLLPGAVGQFDLYVPQDFGSFIGYSYVIDWEEYQ